VTSGGKLSKTQHILLDQAGPGAKDKRCIDLWFQEALYWRPLRLPAKSPNSIGPKPRVPETPSYQSERASDRPVEAFKRSCSGEAQRFSKSRLSKGSQDKNQRTGHRQRRQQISPAATSPTVTIRTLCFLTDLRGSHVI